MTDKKVYYEIANEYINNDISIAKLSKKHKVAPATIKKYVEKLNYKIINKTHINMDLNYDDAKKEYLNSKISLTKLSKKYNISRQHLSKKLKEDNIEIINYQNELRVKENLFNDINDEYSAYWLGFLYADGWISKNTIGLQLAEVDYDHLIKYKDFLKFNGKITKHTSLLNNKEFVSYRISFSDKNISKNLKKLGLNENKTNILEFPTFDQVPKRFLKDFIRVYFDGDGCVYISNDYMRVSLLGTENILLNIINNLNLKHNKLVLNNKNNDQCYVLSYAGKSAYEFMKILYHNSNIHLDRKNKLVLPFIEGIQ